MVTLEEFTKLMQEHIFAIQSYARQIKEDGDVLEEVSRLEQHRIEQRDITNRAKLNHHAESLQLLCAYAAKAGIR